MSTYLITILAIFVMMVIGIGVERLYRYFQARNPNLGPFRKLDGKCTCHCSSCDDEGCRR